MLDYRLRLDGALNTVWEPLWLKLIRLSHEEQALMRSNAVRRLHFIRHGGASFINSHHTYSRLQHTLGVFALAAHFDPDNLALRAAALLHDTGHAPFSHTLDAIEGVDHHQWTKEVVFSDEIVSILSTASISPAVVMDYIDGSTRSLLRNKDGVLHADHLDSWVRSAFVGGYLPISTDELVSGMKYLNGYLQFTPEAGRHALTLIVEEARMHGSPANIGINAMLRKLVRQLIFHGKLDVAELPVMTDAHIEQLLREEASTAEAYDKLLTESWRIRVTRENLTAAAETAILRKLYLATPLVEGVPITDTSTDILKLLEDLQKMLGTYYVSWE
ncbi:HD domain-containing protein [Paenibacillus sp. J5C2022]|uniref:HD domain-containing protein n=1 Tax=Paenibacillus sp. J5C2022 TaxID=2977129 RepID=UPI0021D1EEF0|nr:HD domain-containing protein [Paenibacillus sp. J5C2022]